MTRASFVSCISKINMQNQNFYVVEDMGVTRAAIVSVLKKAGFTWAGSSATAEKAWVELCEMDIAVVLIDVSLKGAKNGIWLAQKIKTNLNCAIIFLTAYGSDALLEKIYETDPDGYIMKPFNNPTLISAVTMACRKRIKKKPIDSAIEEDTVLIKSRKSLIKIKRADVVYLQSNGNYVNIVTKDALYEVRSKLDDLLSTLSIDSLYRVHRRYAINSKFIKSIDNQNIYTTLSTEIPFSKSFDYERLIYNLEQLNK